MSNFHATVYLITVTIIKTMMIIIEDDTKNHKHDNNNNNHYDEYNDYSQHSPKFSSQYHISIYDRFRPVYLL